MFKKIIQYFFILLIFSSSVSAHQGKHLGKINFPTSGNAQAQLFFENGIMLLHSFEYKEARAEFKKAEKSDPDFTMAYWGEAMTYNHPLWNEQDVATAVKTLKILAPDDLSRVKKAKLPIEKGFIHAINLLYGKGDKKFRDFAYADAMRQLYSKNPQDDEIASFYALALLGLSAERDYQHYMQAAGIVEIIIKRNPLHPGAIHYAIHAYDDPIHAPLGLRVACAYAKIAPDATHALHMPSHIFLALGMWDDVIASNKAAWESGVKENSSMDPKAFTVDDLHAVAWLEYGYLQKQQYAAAFQLAKMMEKIAENSNTSIAKWYYAMMRAWYILATQDWDADLKSFDMTHVELSARASNLYANAMIALNSKSKNTQIHVILEELSGIIPKQAPKQEVSKDYFSSVDAGGIRAAKIMLMELQAQIKILEGKLTPAIQILEEAKGLEESHFIYGPPIPVKPSFELLADVLLESKQLNRAFSEYINALKHTPNRVEAQRGLNKTIKKMKAAGISIPEGIPIYFNSLMLADSHP